MADFGSLATAARLAEHATEFPYIAQLRGLVAATTGHRDEALAAILATVNEAMLDGHHPFHLAESYAMAGAHDKAIALLDRAVTRGFYPADYYARFCPFYEVLRGREDFARVVRRAQARVQTFAVDCVRVEWPSAQGARRGWGADCDHRRRFAFGRAHRKRRSSDH